MNMLRAEQNGYKIAGALPALKIEFSDASVPSADTEMYIPDEPSVKLVIKGRSCGGDV